MASNENNVKTRAGILPSEQELPFAISTEDVKNYLQRKLNVVVNKMRQEGLYNGEDIELNITTIEMGSKFIPFAVVLPLTVLKERRKTKNQKEELSIFNPKENDATVVMHDHIHKLFTVYMYDKGDRKSFSGTDWKRARGVSNTVAPVLQRNCIPRVQKFNNGNMERVTFIIDPLRVFHDMLVMENNNANFFIEISDWKKMSAGNFMYYMKRILHNSKKKNKGGNNYVDELTRKMRGYNK